MNVREMRAAGRRSLLSLSALGPLVVALDWFGATGKLTVFVLAVAALVPLAWLLGEATDNAAYYTGPGIGGFLNASGNAPELIIALVAVSDGLTDVLRASLVGSIVWNLLLVLGFTLLFGQRGNATEHASAVLLGRRGRVRLATEISPASGALGVATVLPALVLAHGRTTRMGGAMLLIACAGLVRAFYDADNR